MSRFIHQDRAQRPRFSSEVRTLPDLSSAISRESVTIEKEGQTDSSGECLIAGDGVNVAQNVSSLSRTTPAGGEKEGSRAADAETAPKPLSGSKFIILFSGMLVSVFLIGLDQTIVATAIPRIVSDFDQLQQVPWISSGYLLPQPCFLLLFGQIITIADLKWSYLAGILVFEIGNAICGAAPNMDVLIFGRVLAGVGAAGTTVCFFVLTARISSIGRRALCMGLVGSAITLSSIIGPLIGGVLTDRVSWRWVFYLNVPFGVVTMLLLLILIKSEHSRTSSESGVSAWKRIARLDWIGAILFFGASMTLLLPIQWGGGVKAWSDPDVIICFCLFAVLLPLTILWEWRRGEHSVLPLSLFQSKTQIGCCIEGFILSVSVYYLPLYYESAKQKSATRSGLDIIPFMIPATVCSIGGGALIGRLGRPLPFLVFPPLLAALASGLLYWALMNHATAGDILAFQVILGVGIGLSTQNTIVAIQAEYHDEPQKIPQSTSLVNCAKWSGGVIGLAAAGAMFNNRLSTSIHQYAPSLPPETVTMVKESILIIATLQDPDKQNVIRAYSDSMGCVFALGIPVSILASISGACLIKNFDLRMMKQRPRPPVTNDSV
ncbi:hypothetical protein FRB96_005107 [Tulasnella sp. 330]|nr:hypothetical protein FRB96_005107 [Tulasnella sp. 330]